MITTQNRLAAANIATSNLKSGTDFSIAAIMARDELSRESSEFSISKPRMFITFLPLFESSNHRSRLKNTKNALSVVGLKCFMV